MTIPTIHDAIVIANSSDRQIHALGYHTASDARERAAEMLAEALEERIARCNHIINYCEAYIDAQDYSLNRHLNNLAALARGIAPDATSRALEVA